MDAEGAGLDLPGYLDRIGYCGPVQATAETLAAVVAGHTRHIPFENLDPLCGVPVEDLRAAALTAKLVGRRRGGYCYEHNTLLRYVLEQLGFGVDALGARVVWMSPTGVDGPPRAETHQTLAVRIPGVDDRFLVDVGFGGQTLTAPIRLVAGPAQQTDLGAFRIRSHDRWGGGYLLETLLGRNWQPMYTFTDRPRPLIDLELGSWYVSTHPRSLFVTGLSAALVVGDARMNLHGRTLSVHHHDGPTERTRLASAAAVVEVLGERFGLDVSGRPAVTDRIAAVLGP
ncbi:MAG TPA: arylamine N-acetyltransferase [Mycolicibacillus parakoreensis]|nr:arylamine N-acetyltransferase [Mycolicibacillus parakoreensis]